MLLRRSGFVLLRRSGFALLRRDRLTLLRRGGLLRATLGFGLARTRTTLGAVLGLFLPALLSALLLLSALGCSGQHRRRRRARGLLERGSSLALALFCRLDRGPQGLASALDEFGRQLVSLGLLGRLRGLEQRQRLGGSVGARQREREPGKNPRMTAELLARKLELNAGRTCAAWFFEHRNAEVEMISRRELAFALERGQQWTRLSAIAREQQTVGLTAEQRRQIRATSQAGTVRE